MNCEKVAAFFLKDMESETAEKQKREKPKFADKEEVEYICNASLSSSASENIPPSPDIFSTVILHMILNISIQNQKVVKEKNLTVIFLFLDLTVNILSKKTSTLQRRLLSQTFRRIYFKAPKLHQKIRSENEADLLLTVGRLDFQLGAVNRKTASYILENCGTENR
jgi:hypothetical protein